MRLVTARALVRMYRHVLKPRPGTPATATGAATGAAGGGGAGGGAGGGGGGVRLGARKLQRAVELFTVDGWRLGCDPAVMLPDWPIVAVPADDRWAPVMQATFEASSEQGESHAASVERGSLERLLGAPIHEPAATARLARVGLALLRPEEEGYMPLRSTFPDLAVRVNRLRHGTPRCGYEARVLLTAAIGHKRVPGRVTEKMRWQAAWRLEDFDVEASALLEADGRIHPQSRWRLRLPDAEPVG